MSYLVDTNVLSELRRKQPDANVVQWFSARPAGTLHLSVLTLGELRKGVEALSDQNRRLALLDWLETDLPAFFEGRILAVDQAVAELWGRMQAQAGRGLDQPLECFMNDGDKALAYILPAGFPMPAFGRIDPHPATPAIAAQARRETM